MRCKVNENYQYVNWKEKGDTLTLKDINNIKVVLNYFLIKQGFESDIMDLETEELFNILNRDIMTSKLEDDINDE